MRNAPAVGTFNSSSETPRRPTPPHPPRPPLRPRRPRDLPVPCPPPRPGWLRRAPARPRGWICSTTSAPCRVSPPGPIRCSMGSTWRPPLRSGPLRRPGQRLPPRARVLRISSCSTCWGRRPRRLRRPWHRLPVSPRAVLRRRLGHRLLAHRPRRMSAAASARSRSPIRSIRRSACARTAVRSRIAPSSPRGSPRCRAPSACPRPARARSSCHRSSPSTWPTCRAPPRSRSSLAAVPAPPPTLPRCPPSLAAASALHRPGPMCPSRSPPSRRGVVAARWR